MASTGVGRGETCHALVTGVGAPAGRSVALRLRARGLRVVGSDPDVHAAADSRDGTAATAAGSADLPWAAPLRLPPPGHPDRLGALRRAVREHGVRLVVPTLDAELPLLSAARAGFDPGVEVLVAASGPVRIAGDRLSSAVQLQALGLPVPRFALPSEVAGFAGAVAALGRSFVVKPRVPGGGGRLTVVRSAAQFDAAAADDSSVLQAFVSGAGYAPVVHRRPGTGEEVVAVLERLAAPAGEAGAPWRVRRVRDGQGGDVAALAGAAVRALGLEGPVTLDVRRRWDGRPVVLGVTAAMTAAAATVDEVLDALLAGPAFRGGRAA